MFSISLIGRYPYPDEVYELQKYDNEKNHETSHIDDQLSDDSRGVTDFLSTKYRSGEICYP